MLQFLIAICFILLTYEFYKYLCSKPPGTPPGIVGLPIVGAYWFLLWGNYKFPHKTFGYYTKKLKSKIISCYLGSFFTVVANDYPSIKEILMREEFDGRVSDAYATKARAFNKKLGVFFIEGEPWREQRRFALRHMRDFGLGRRHETFEANAMEELTVFMDLLRNGPINDSEKEIHKNGMVLFPDILYAVAVNNVWDIMFGYRFDRAKHEKLRYFSRQAIKFQRSGDTSAGAIILWPIVCKFGNLFKFKSLMEGNYGMINFVKEYLNKYEELHGEDSEYGFVGRYLSKMKESGLSPSFSEEQLIMSMIDFMFPAVSAIPSVITTAIKFLLHNPDVARKVREEIHRVVGTGRLVNWDDRNNLPYTEATLRESMRLETLTPLSLFHKSTRDTTLQGYFIPAGTVIITNLYEMNHDPDMWDDPEKFQPERFLNEDGQLNKDLSLPFSLGHRVCPGETFARLTMFGTFASLLQNFKFSFVEGQPTGIDDKLPGFITSPMETWIRLKPCV